MRRAIYAGSFDPPTKGHEWMIKEGSKLFDHLIIAVGVNEKKKTLLSASDREQLLREIVSTAQLPEATILSYENKLTAKLAYELDAPFLLRGIRSVADLEQEMLIASVNRNAFFSEAVAGLGSGKSLETVFLNPPHHLGDVRSSVVKSLMVGDNWDTVVSSYVPANVLKLLRELPK